MGDTKGKKYILMKPGDTTLANEINNNLKQFSELTPLPGIDSEDSRKCFLEQMVDSVHRIKYVTTIRNREISPLRADATSDIFDPIKAAIWHKNQGNIDEAFWLVFLSIHFGKNLRTGWNLVKGVYGGGVNSAYWTWERICTNTEEFLHWLDENKDALKANGKFGNHRKYQSIKAFSSTGTGATITSYIDWVGSASDHQIMIERVRNEAGSHPHALFQALYNSMKEVVGFGRTGKFDYLTMLGKIGLADIEPGSAYLTGATGPLEGARLLFTGSNSSTEVNIRDLNELLVELGNQLNLHFGMQVLEDALCNWQKSPDHYISFRG